MKPNLWLRVYEIIKPFRAKLLFATATLFALTGLGLLPPIWGAKLVGVALPEGNHDLFIECVVILVCLHISNSVISFAYGYQMRILGGRLVFDLRRRMYDHLQRLSLGFYESRSSGEIISRMMNDVNSVTSLVTGTVLNTLISSVKALALVGVLFYQHSTVAIVALAVLPLHFLGYFFFNARISHFAWKSTEKMSQIYGKVSEVVGAIKMVKSHSGERRESRSLIGQMRENYDIDLYSGNLASVWGKITGNISYAGEVLVMLVCGQAVFGQELTVEEYLLLMSYVAMLYSPISELISVVQQILPAKVGIRRVFEVIDTAPEVDDDPEGIIDALKGEVQFEDVSFSYDTGDSVLTAVSFIARPGEVVAFVGPSGSGKTTIANLIARFYDRDEGNIQIDGRDIRDYALLALREQMSMVLQETHLFRGTILDNIRYGKPDANMDEIEAAARQATRMSGGQRQRIAIARALIRNPRILILDEATSALDTVSETKVQEALNHLMKDRTTFVIAHRLSTVQNADKIVVLKEGRVEQIGRHEDLIKGDGLYRELYDPEWAKKRNRDRDERIRKLAEAV